MRNWTKGIVAGLLAGAVILGSLPALAEPYGPYLGRREMVREYRIHQARRHLAAARMRGPLMRGARMHRWERARFYRMGDHSYNHPYWHNYYRPAIWTPGWH
jgi:hypothetical protein